MKYLSITVSTISRDADLVASAMFDAGAGGVSILDSNDFLELVKSDVIWDYVDESVLKHSDIVKVSTVVETSDGEFMKRLSERLAEMRKAGGITYGEIVSEVIDNADYENEWKKYYKPIKTAHITVVPTWIKYEPEEGERVMRLDPGMAFGTGSHATTRMCLELMDAKDEDVIDVGCGSGILGIAAALTGAKSVYMCDIDPLAVEFATQNAKQNGVNVTVECADLLEGERKADLIIANITADILMRFARDIDKHLNPGGSILLSGIIDERLDEVETVYTSAGFARAGYMTSDGWNALLLKRKQEI